MSYDPTKPANSTPLSSAEMRAQLTALHDEITAVPAVTGAVVDSVTTGGAGSPATATATLTAGVLHLSFAIPEGSLGPPGPQGNPGEVTPAQLSNDLSNTQNATMLATLPLTSANSNAVSTLGISSGDFNVQTLIDKLNELINALRR